MYLTQINQKTSMARRLFGRAGHPLATNRVLHLGPFALSTYSRNFNRRDQRAVCCGPRAARHPVLETTEAVSSHPGGNGRWEPKKASKQSCARKQPKRTGKKFL
jgi:hypothetical protein